MAYPPHQGGPPTSFKTNVNRAKTKRWVEAKSYTYDGDDWGDMDEYDEYGGYDEPPPPPRPTGLRQQGQSASREQTGYEHHQQSQHTYGNLGRQPPAQQQYGARSVTNPPYQQSQLQRSGSFDRGDERRAFSAAGPHQGPPPTSAMYQETPYVQGPVAMPQHHQSGEGLPHPSNYLDMQDRPVQRDRNYHQSADNPPSPYPEQQHRTSMGTRTQSMTSNNSTIDLQSRRDFSPSAVPPPLQTRDSPSPQRSSEHQSLTRPPRKSSLGQQNHPEQSHARQASLPPSGIDQEGRPAALRERAGSDLSKPLPFVRPADIYRRMQEEKERERQSQDSSRPSMDVIMADDSPKNDPRSDSIGASERGRESKDQDAPRPFMNPVIERGSENKISGISSNETEILQAPRAEQNVVAEPAKVAGSTGINTGLSPQLPDVARMSGFGELFASAPRQTEASTPSSASQRDDAAHPSLEQPPQGRSGSPLQHQPSLGFRSVVHQAFDITNEPIPETPSSSTADSSIGRSGSGGTSAVSPIISRGPSSATTNLNIRDPQNRPATPPSGGERDIDDRPMSSGSLGTPKADPRRYSPDPTDPRPARFMPGHRRDLSTPSPDNSPARTPALEANKQLQQPQEAELATTTPIETRFPQSYEQTTKPSSRQTSPAKSSITAEPTSPIKSPSEQISNSPAESTRSRVRNLADRFESGRSSPAGSERAPSPIKTSFSPSSVTSQPRPLPADRLESFRPKLPGGWESSASIAPLAAPNKNEAPRPSVSLEQRLQNSAAGRSSPSDALPSSTDGQVQTQDPPASSPSEVQEASPLSDPFASLAAAGSALAGAFSSVVGAEENGSNRDQSPVKTARRSDPSTEKEGRDSTAPKFVMDNSYIPEASKPMMLATPDDGTSSIMPTPLDKLSQPGLSEGNRAADYFTSGTYPQQQSSVDSSATQDGASKKRPVLLPSLSTDNGSQYESDRLRREIIRELSPRLTSEPSTAESSSSVQQDSRHPAQPRQQNQSLVIPREYDSYWNGSDSERSSQASSPKGPPQESQGVMDVNFPKLNTLSPRSDVEKPSPILQDAVSRPQENMPEMPERPGPPPHRFSWEVPSERTTPKPTPVRNLPEPEPPSQSISARDDSFDTPEALLSLHQDIAGQEVMHFSDPSQTPIGIGALLQAEDTQQSLEPRGAIQVTEGKRSMESARSDQRVALENPSYHEQPKPEPKTVPTNDAPRQHQGIDPSVEIAPNSSEPLSTANDVLLPPAPPNVAPKIPSFREILSLKEPRDRIKGYNEAREQFANMDTGLAHWLAVTTTELPEHKEILPNGKLAGISGAKPVTSRTNKLGGLLPANSFTHQLHYANSPSGTSDGAQVSGGNTHQGHSPSAGSVKMSSQQRGKDLLHTAGVFSGKANVAAKGLFSKGKSKLRGANADKV
ncbi:MAG: hypothetical protein Q9176_007169 [Flavoplaca citrina]